MRARLDRTDWLTHTHIDWRTPHHTTYTYTITHNSFSLFHVMFDFVLLWFWTLILIVYAGFWLHLLIYLSNLTCISPTHYTHPHTYPFHPHTTHPHTHPHPPTHPYTKNLFFLFFLFFSFLFYMWCSMFVLTTTHWLSLSHVKHFNCIFRPYSRIYLCYAQFRMAPFSERWF